MSLLLLLIFFVDATITVWRRGDRRRALVVGGSMIFGAILACHVPLVIWGIIDIPFFLSFAYSGIVAAMAYELSYDLLHAAQLAGQLQASEADLRETEERMEQAASASQARHVDVGYCAKRNLDNGQRARPFWLRIIGEARPGSLPKRGAS